MKTLLGFMLSVFVIVSMALAQTGTREQVGSGLGGSGGDLTSNLKMELERAKLALDLLQGQIQSNPQAPLKAKELFNSALTDLRNANSSFQAGDFRNCSFLLSIVSQKIQQLRDILRNLQMQPPRPDMNMPAPMPTDPNYPNKPAPDAHFRPSIEQLGDLVQKAIRIAEQSDQPKSEKWVEKLENLLESARQAFRNRDRTAYNRAAYEIRRISQRIFEKEGLEKNDLRLRNSDAKIAVARAEEALTKAQATVDANCKLGLKLIEKSREALEQARNLVETDEAQAAVSRSQTAVKLSHRAIEVCASQEGGNPERIQIRISNDLKRLEALLEKVEALSKKSEEAEVRTLLQQAQQNAAEAKASLEGRHFRMAERQIIVARTLAYKALAIIRGR